MVAQKESVFIKNIFEFKCEGVISLEEGLYISGQNLIALYLEKNRLDPEKMSQSDWSILHGNIQAGVDENEIQKVFLGPPTVPFQERGEYYFAPLKEPERTVTYVHQGSKNQNAFDLMPDDLPVPKLYGQEKVSTDETIIWVKLFSPGNWTWYITEYRPEEKLAFGYVDGFEREWGYISIAEIEEMNAKWRATNNGYDMTFVERDLHFQPMTFSDLKWSVLDKEDD